MSTSTQQLVDRGSDAGKNLCAFNKVSQAQDTFSLIDVNIFNSQSDALKIERAGNSSLTLKDFTAANGYISVGKYFVHVKAPQDMRGNCLSNDSAFENQQRQLLYESLITLRTSS